MIPIYTIPSAGIIILTALSFSFNGSQVIEDQPRTVLDNARKNHLFQKTDKNGIGRTYDSPSGSNILYFPFYA